MSRNEGRLGSVDDLVIDDESPLPAAAMASAPQDTASPTFNWAIPTDFVDLPSRGKLYPQGTHCMGKKMLN